MLQPIPAGFSRPVFESQGVFRVILQAMSHPGQVVPMPARPRGPLNWPGAMAAAVLTLCDMDTPLWLDPAAGTSEALRFVRFHCGSPVVDAPRKAAFAVILDPENMPDLEAFSSGSAEYPERSATVLLSVATSAPPDRRIFLHGPGVAGRNEFPRNWLPEGFTDRWQFNFGLFPRGVDVILAGEDFVVGLPRTVSMEEEPCM